MRSLGLAGGSIVCTVITLINVVVVAVSTFYLSPMAVRRGDAKTREFVL